VKGGRRERLPNVSDEELIRLIREAASHWFNNDQLLLLEELIRRARLGRLGDRGV